MKKLLILLFLLMTTLTLSKEKSISDIKTLEFLTKEEIILNRENRKTEYNIKFQIPDKIKKEIIAPELNKGEVYIYNHNEKIVYLPLFEQVTHEKVNTDENRIIKVINYIFEQEKENEDFRKKYYASKIGELILEDGVKIEFEKFSNHKYLKLKFIIKFSPFVKVNFERVNTSAELCSLVLLFLIPFNKTLIFPKFSEKIVIYLSASPKSLLFIIIPLQSNSFIPLV